jgi:hypothetical protein
MQFYISQLSSRKKPMSDIAQKRFRLNTQSHVLTSEEYATLTTEIQNQRTLQSAHTPVPIVSSSSASSDTETTETETSKHSRSSSDTENLLPTFPRPVPCAGNYVVVKYIPFGQKKMIPAYYVGLLLNESSDGIWRIKCMRRRGTLNKFTFPRVDDISEFQVTDIMTFLTEPKLVRAVHHFTDDFSRFSSTLR